MKLFEINKKIEEFFENNIDPETGEILDFSELEALSIAREEKIENTMLVYKNLSAEYEAVVNQRKIFEKREASAKKSLERLKNYIAYILDGESFVTDKVKASWRKSQTVVVQDGVVLPEEYTTKKITISPNKTALKQAIESGITIDGVYIKDNNNLTVK